MTTYFYRHFSRKKKHTHRERDTQAHTYPHTHTHTHTTHDIAAMDTTHTTHTGTLLCFSISAIAGTNGMQ